MIIQRLFSSKAQKKLREKYEVLKGQDLIDRDNKVFHKDADEALKRAAKNKLPEGHPTVKSAAELKARAIINDQISEEIRKNPQVESNISEGGRKLFINNQKVYNKKLARSGMNQENFLRSGGVRARNEKNKNRPRGIKKVKGEKVNSNGGRSNMNKDLRASFLNREHQEKFYENIKRREQVKESIANHESKAAELRAKKELGKNLKKGGKIALATGGVVAAGIGAKKLADKKKAKKEEKK